MTSLAISSDGELLVSGHADGTLQRWRAHVCVCVGESLRCHNGWVNGLALSEDGNRIVPYSEDCGMRLWDTFRGEAFGTPLRGHGGSVTCFAIIRDSNLVMFGLTWDDRII